jgi:hypothetical protein
MSQSVPLHFSNFRQKKLVVVAQIDVNTIEDCAFLELNQTKGGLFSSPKKGQDEVKLVAEVVEAIQKIQKDPNEKVKIGETVIDANWLKQIEAKRINSGTDALFKKVDAFLEACFRIERPVPVIVGGMSFYLIFEVFW